MAPPILGIMCIKYAEFILDTPFGPPPQSCLRSYASVHTSMKPCRTIIISYVWISFCTKNSVGCRFFWEHTCGITRAHRPLPYVLWPLSTPPTVQDSTHIFSCSFEVNIVWFRQFYSREQIRDDSFKQWNVRRQKLQMQMQNVCKCVQQYIAIQFQLQPDCPTFGRFTSMIDLSKRMSSFSSGNFSFRFPAAANTDLTARMP